MSGHSKWSTIKRKKGKADAESTRIFAEAFGVDPALVAERLNGLSHAELMQLEGQIESQVAGGDVEGEAFVRVQFASMRTAALLDVIPLLVLVLAILHAHPLLALVDGVLALVAAALAKPDFVNTLLATESRLRRS